MHKVISSVHHISFRVLLLSLIALAVLSLAGRILISNLEYFKTEIEQELADYGITGVSLNAVSGSWSGIHPVLQIQGASLSIPGRSQALSINELELRVKMLPSLFSGDLKLAAFHTTIEKLVLVHDKQGIWWLNDIPLSAVPAEDGEPLDIHTLFQRLPDLVNVDIRLIQIRDQMYDREYVIQRSSLHSFQRDGLLTLNLQAHLPFSLGGQLSMLLKGDADHQQLYLQARELNLVPLLQLAGYDPLTLSQARVSVQSWLDLDAYHLTRATNQADITQAIFKHPKTLRDTLPLRASMLQQVRFEAGQWNFASRFENIQLGSRSLSDLNTEVKLGSDRHPVFWLEALKLDEILEISRPWIADKDLAELLELTKPEAQLQNLVVEFVPDQPAHSTFSFEFSDLQNHAYKSLPAINGLAGKVTYRQDRLHFETDSKDVKLEFASVFRQPLLFDQLSASINASILNDGFVFQSERFSVSNADVSAEGRAWVEGKRGVPPYLSLRAHYRNGMAEANSKYLPVNVMPQPVIDWLDRSIQGGEITSGDFIYHSRLQKLSTMTKQGSGELLADFQVSNPQVKFRPDWPVADQGQGRAHFHNLSMDLDFHDVRFASSRVGHVKVRIPNLLKTEVLIDAETQTRADNLIETLSALPVLDAFDEIRARYKRADGVVDGTLKLGIPVSRKLNKKVSVRVDAELQNVSLSIPEWLVDFHRTNGRLTLRDHQVKASSLSTLYYGDKAVLNVQTDRKTNATVFELTGLLNTHSLAGLLPAYLQQPISGKSRWDIAVAVANKSSADSAFIRFNSSSDLQGTELAYPRPFKLEKNSKADFSINGQWFRSNRLVFESSLGDRARVTADLDLNLPGAEQIHELKLFLGQDNRPLQGNGIQLVGTTDDLDLNDWNRYLDHYFPDDGSGSGNIVPAVQKVDLFVRQMTWGNQDIANTWLQLNNDGKDIQGTVRSSQISGKLTIPFESNPAQPLTAELDYLRFNKTDLKSDVQHDINDMPNLEVHSKQMTYDNMEFTDFVLKTHNSENKFEVDQLDFARDQVQLRSSGHWQYNPLSHDNVSVFNIDIRGKNFGKVVSGLGLGETLNGGNIDFNGQIGWAGSLYDINWPSLIGEARLSLKNGYLRNVDPGAGRFVGLLSLNALPKRLFLDFGDVVREGMQFNEIKGGFTIDGEIMTTRNALMDGSSARIKLKGDTNLRKQTYDQIMTIIPKVGDTLPVIGTLAAGNTVGWGLLLLQRLFKKPIDKSVAIEYKVSGSWENPQITLVKKPEPEAVKDADE